jgi:VacB/RNase II family 3'-5' exoribonuclease
MSKRKKKAQKHEKNRITKGIFTVLENDPSKDFNYKQIAAKLGINDASGRNLLIKKLIQLKESKRILEVERGRYKALANRNYLTGIIDINSRGNAYVITDDLDEDVFIPNSKFNKALHKDEVEIYVYPRRKGKRPEGEVTRIIKRAKTAFVGIIQIKTNFAFVTTRDPRMYTDIFIPKGNIGKAAEGDKVLVEILDWKDNSDSPNGKVVDVLGKPGEHNTEMHAILAEYGLPYSFPDEVESYANKLDTSITAEEIKKRRDMRSITTFTIDPKDAKDFDDALSFRLLENNNFEIGIHIADVSHYLEPGSVLDEEAYERATSIYLVDRVVPMLPEILSNGACSLRPHEEKYTFSAVFEMDSRGKVYNQWFGRTITYSDRRFAYEEAQAIIESGSNKIPKEVSLTGNSYEVEDNITEAILTMDKIAKKYVLTA